MINFFDIQTQKEKIRKMVEKRFSDILNHGKFIMGPEVYELEEKLADYTGVKNVISCSSGTDAILIPLLAMGVGPGDAVFTTPFTYVATVEVISIIGATPVFVDVYGSTFNIDCEKLEEEIQKVIKEGKLTPKAIIPVDLFGMPARYRKIQLLANKFNLKVIEDAAQSFGGSIRNQKTCSFGDVAATSFYPTKPLSCYGDGGAIFTNDDQLAEICRALRIHGTTKDKYHSELIGLNGRLDSIQAAVLLEKLEIFEEELEQRRNIELNYRNNLNNVQYHPKGYSSANALFTLRLNSKEKRNKLQEFLASFQIPTAVYYKYPVHLMAAYRYLGYSKGDFPISESLCSEVLSIPMHPYLIESEVSFIIEKIQFFDSLK